MYEISYSERVLDALVDLVRRNPAQANAIRNAFREINRRLRIYPQFGQPLRDLAAESAQQWVGVYSPLVIHYIVVEGDGVTRKRQVIVVRPLEPLPRLGIS